MEFPYAKDSIDRMPLEHYMSLYQNADPKEISERCGIPYDEERKVFTVRLMEVTYEVSFPSFEAKHIDNETLGYYPLEDSSDARILVLRYLVEGAAVPDTGKFMTYRETPWGSVYLKQFQGRCISRLAFGFGNKQDLFEKAMEKIHAVKVNHGDIAYEFEVINGFRIQMILWAGDDEFPPSSQILFSDNFPASFQAYDMAVVGDVTITMIKVLSK